MKLMIRVEPRYKSRNHEIVARMRQTASGARVDLISDIQKNAVKIASAMALLHGGEWTPVVDHEHRIVLVRPV